MILARNMSGACLILIIYDKIHNHNDGLTQERRPYNRDYYPKGRCYKIKRLIIAITGASGAIYGIRALIEAKELGVETHLLISKWGKVTITAETDFSVAEVEALADYCYQDEDLASPLASGATPWDGMLVAPCSMKTLAGIAHGLGGGLILRTAEIALKEHRRLLLMTRETPLSAIHLDNMLRLAKLGVTIMPPVPAFYHRPDSVEALVQQSVARALGQFGLEPAGLKRWQGKY